ncbi:hypothetical protein BZG36_01499 [Bifiguratus adelaidae]|uniref:Sulfotransferase domain-containing protein n=1 Tax=Bifiguratus adelaidae TaxID=1938954 RepID=A0A261Y4W5_9FUNG|nr:hypothetical protein BZG36_01499 [Bifiguratus adelaidae]
MSGRRKVFCIGLNKTGTTSLGDALASLGYRRSGWHDYTSRRLMHQWLCGDIEAMARYAAQYDVLEDFPWPLVYREMADQFPDALFILSVRQSEEAWLSSVSRHTARRKWIGHKIIYGSYDTHNNHHSYLDVYRGHLESVKAYFADKPDRLLRLSIDETTEWKEICTFIGVPDIPTRPFPRSNSASAQHDLLGLTGLVDRLFHVVELFVMGLVLPQHILKAIEPEEKHG